MQSVKHVRKLRKTTLFPGVVKFGALRSKQNLANFSAVLSTRLQESCTTYHRLPSLRVAPVAVLSRHHRHYVLFNFIQTWFLTFNQLFMDDKEIITQLSERTLKLSKQKLKADFK